MPIHYEKEPLTRTKEKRSITVGARMDNDLYKAFKSTCEERGFTISSVLKKLIRLIVFSDKPVDMTGLEEKLKKIINEELGEFYTRVSGRISQALEKNDI